MNFVKVCAFLMGVVLASTFVVNLHRVHSALQQQTTTTLVEDSLHAFVLDSRKSPSGPLRLQKLEQRKRALRVEASAWPKEASQPGSRHYEITQNSTAQAPYNKEHQSSSSSSLSTLYWNLSCPVEMSIFSGSHMGGTFLPRAEQARQLVRDHRVLSQIQSQVHTWSSRRIVFVGDSLLRQVFISMVCLSLPHVQRYSIPWFHEGHSRAPHPHTVQRGRHSKFQEARVVLQNQVELIYHHGIGKLLELGQDYTTHETHNWLDSCSQQAPLSTNVVVLPPAHGGEYEMTDASAKRERMQLNRNDIVLLNGSVHGKRDANIANLAALLDCAAFVKAPRQTGWPTFAYVMTGTDHFPTPDGKFDEALLLENHMENYDCRPDAPRHDLQDQDVSTFESRTTLLGQTVVEESRHAGDLHVGGKDCLHWMQPGIPDLLAAEVSTFVASRESQLDQRLALATTTRYG